MHITDRIGLPKNLSIGYIGVLIFMMGDGVEQGWLSPYLVEQGLSMEKSALLFTAYGVTVGISAWLSGVLVESFGPRKIMLTGLFLYIVGTIGFVGIGLPDLNYELMLPTYAMRGFGYPFFAYSFLVWITYNSPQFILGRAVGWFWFVFTGGLVVLGSYYSSWAIVKLGYIPTLWSSIIWVLIGAFLAIRLNKASFKKFNDEGKPNTSKLLAGFTVIREEPKVLLGGIVRIINTTAQFAFPVFIPTYLAEFGFSTSEWLQIWGTIFIANIGFNLLFGFIGDTMGWRNTVLWFGGVGCGFSTLLFFYSPSLFGANFWLVMACGILWGALLAGYVPLSALIPSLVKNKGAAMSILNLGAGLAVFVGPALVGLFITQLGSEGVVWILAGLYFISAFLTHFINLPQLEHKAFTSRNKKSLLT